MRRATYHATARAMTRTPQLATTDASSSVQNHQQPHVLVTGEADPRPISPLISLRLYHHFHIPTSSTASLSSFSLSTRARTVALCVTYNSSPRGCSRGTQDFSVWQRRQPNLHVPSLPVASRQRHHCAGLLIRAPRFVWELPESYSS